MKRAILLLAVALVIVCVGVVLLVLGGAGIPRVGNLSKHAPERTSLMKAREREARREGRYYRVDQRWVSYRQISPLLRNAVLIAEDDAFFSHDGLDWEQLEAAARTNLEKKRVIRGGSTITQQLAKNLYLGEERTIVRKLKEIVLAMRIEKALTKRRIFELYLNLIEWGDGVFGAEAAARRYFGVSASQLDARQAALLASVIINPRRYSPTSPNRRIQRRMQMILGRMVRRGMIDRNQYLVALGRAPEPSGFFDWLFGPPKPEPPPEQETPSPPPIVDPEPGQTDTTEADSAESDTLPIGA